MRGFGAIAGGMRGFGSGLEIGASASSASTAYTLQKTTPTSVATWSAPASTPSPMSAESVAAIIQGAGSITGTIASAVSTNKAIAAAEAEKKRQRQKAAKAAKAAAAAGVSAPVAAYAPPPAAPLDGFPVVTALLVVGAVGAAYLLTRPSAPPAQPPRSPNERSR